MKSIFLRGAMWYLRKHVPEPLRPFFDGKREVWRSLATKDKREADRRFHAAMAKLDVEFEAAERKLHAAEEEAAEMASNRADAALDRFAKLAGPMGLPSSAFAPACSGDAKLIEEALRYGQLQTRPKSRAEMAKMIDKALAQLDWEKENEVHYAIGKDPDGEPIWCLPFRYVDALEQWVEAQFEATRRTLEALRAEFMADGQAALPAASASARTGKGRTAVLGSLRSLVAVWTDHRQPASTTQADMKTALDRFERLNGPLPYREITVEHVRRFKEDLLRDTGIKAATKQKQWTMVRSLLTIAREDGLLAASPFDQVKLGKLKDDSEAREVLTRDDLVKLFATLEGEEWWLVRMGLYTGARLGELCQLRKQDVIVDGGVTYLQITDDPEAGKTVKTRNSVRRVPIHQQLMQDGFGKWIDARPQDQLFSFTSSVASKRLLRRFKTAGLGEGKVVHSLRHTFIGAARRVMEEDWRERITGHKSQRVSRTYGDYADLKARIDLVMFGLEL
jgi:integrase